VYKTLLSWSSGKDSAWALHLLRQHSGIEVTGLFCAVNQKFGRVAMHGVRTELLRQQAEHVGLPVQLVHIPNPCDAVEYEAIMGDFVEHAKQQGVGCFAFGDLFLEDIRRYREARLAATGIAPLFPLWGMPTKELSREMVTGGLRAKITCIDPRYLSADFSGQEYDLPFLHRLPADIDPCGENGEFHSFAYDGPMFRKPVRVAAGETVARDGFIFTDLLPGNTLTTTPGLMEHPSD
jgi:uncharacterized protein (TIGR00290 family)